MLPNANVVKPFSPAGLQAPATAKRQPSGAPTTRCVAARLIEMGTGHNVRQPLYVTNEVLFSYHMCYVLNAINKNIFLL